jgi:AdoMet-dependent rRNA methyltransferase SPB1
MGATLGDEDDVDLGDDDEEGGEDDDDEGGQNEDESEDDEVHVKGKSLQVVEGKEDSYDVDYYGNYIPSERSNRVRIFEAGLEAEDDDGEEEETEETRKTKKKEAQRQHDGDELDEAAKQSKWQRRHKNIDQVLNRTFPKPRDGKKKSSRTEEEQIVMSADREDVDKRRTSAPSSSVVVPQHARLKFDGKVEDEDEDEDGELGSLGSLSNHASDEDDIEIRQGRVDSRKKRVVIPDIGKLTTMELVKQQRKQTVKENKEKQKENKKRSKKAKKGETDNRFEEIPVAMTDPHIRSRTLAIATKMLDKRSRRDILDASINRFMNNDDDDLPDWFVKDEQRNCKVMLPVTAAEVEYERERFLEINARPSKRVAEAVGRKRRKAQRMLRGVLEKGKTDPRARQKAAGLSVRKLMRSTAVKGGDINKKKNKPLDAKSMGERKRTKQKLKKRR